MSVVSVKELFQRRRSSIKAGKQTHSRAWLVTTDNKLDGTAVALLAPGVPREGDTLNGDPLTRVTSVDAQPHENSPTHFAVEVCYEGVDFDSIDVHPLDRTPEYTLGGDSTSENYFVDHSRPPKPYVNSAADTFEQLGEREGGDLTLTVTMNLAWWDVFQSDAYRHTTNADVVHIDNASYAPDVLKMGVIGSVKTNENYRSTAVEFYRVTFPIKIDKDGWKDKPLDYGFNTVKQVTKTINNVPTLVNVKTPILDAAGLKLVKPWPLDGEGRAKSSATGTPATLEFTPYASVPWAAIGLR